MNRLVLGNLLHRPLRSAISILAVAIEVAMILSIVGIMVGQIEGSRRQSSGIGADLIVRPPNASFIAGLSGAPIPAKVADVLRQLPHVAVASPAIQQISVEAALETIWGIDYASFNALRPFVYLSGGPFEGPNDVIVDDFFARSGPHYAVGDSIIVLKNKFRICGIVEHGKGGRKYVPLRTLAGLIGSADNASLIFVKSDDPKNDQLIQQEIHARPGMSEYQVQTLAESLSQMTPEHLPAFNTALNVVIGIAVVVGIAFGVGATFVLKAVMDNRFPTLPFPVSPHWIVNATIIAFLGALVGAMYPALKAAGKDPIEALAYE